MSSEQPCHRFAVDIESDPDMRRDHIATLLALRRHGPFFFSPTGGHGEGMYVVTSYHLFREITRNTDLFSNRLINVASPRPPRLNAD